VQIKNGIHGGMLGEGCGKAAGKMLTASPNENPSKKSFSNL
jgi:hypothetical protein